MTGPVWRKRRRIAALLQAVAILALPFLKVGGESALRFDIPGMRLFLFGSVLWIDEFHLVLVGTLFWMLLGVGVTVIFGRVWCGWICPQTVIPELAAWVTERLPGRRNRWVAQAVLLSLTAVVSLSLILYFLPTGDLARDLFRSKIVTDFFLVQWGILYLMLGPVGPRFCRSVCPYSMLQNALFDRDTLVIEFDRERAEECMRCDLCVDVCPVEIDIKEGPTRECIACAECIDACLQMTAPHEIPPFLSYRGTVIRGKALLWAGVSAATGLVFLLLLARQPWASFSVQWVEKDAASGLNRYRFQVQNRGGDPLDLILEVTGGGQLVGEREIHVPPRGRVNGLVMVRRKAGTMGPVHFKAVGSGMTFREEAGFP